MCSWREYHSTVLVLGTILRTLDCVYLQLSGRNPSFAKLKVWENAQWCIVYPMTPVACAVSTARHVVSCLGWLHCRDNLRTTQLVSKCMRSERSKWCVMHEQRAAPWTVLTASIQFRIEASRSWGACRFCKLKAGPFCVRYQQNVGYESKLSYLTSWTKISPELENIYLFFPSRPLFSFHPVLYTQPASWAILTSHDFHRTTHFVPKHTR